jgi:hypothetical protein
VPVHEARASALAPPFIPTQTYGGAKRATRQTRRPVLLIEGLKRRFAGGPGKTIKLKADVRLEKVETRFLQPALKPAMDFI